MMMKGRRGGMKGMGGRVWMNRRALKEGGGV